MYFFFSKNEQKQFGGVSLLPHRLVCGVGEGRPRGIRLRRSHYPTGQKSTEKCLRRKETMFNLSCVIRCGINFQALSDVEEEDKEATALRRGREVIIDEHGLVTLCPDLGYYDGPSGAGGGGIYRAAAAYPNSKDRTMPSMQARRKGCFRCIQCSFCDAHLFATLLQNLRGDIGDIGFWCCLGSARPLPLVTPRGK